MGALHSLHGGLVSVTARGASADAVAKLHSLHGGLGICDASRCSSSRKEAGLHSLHGGLVSVTYTATNQGDVADDCIAFMEAWYL